MLMVQTDVPSDAMETFCHSLAVLNAINTQVTKAHLSLSWVANSTLLVDGIHACQLTLKPFNNAPGGLVVVPVPGRGTGEGWYLCP